MKVGPNDVSKDVEFAERFEYHRHLVSRRWQYIATYIVLNGLLLTEWEQLNTSTRIRPIFVAAMLLIACAFLRLIDRCRRRIRINAIALNTLVPQPVLEVGGYRLSLRGITLWLFMCIIALSIPWFAILYSLSKLLFVIIALTYCAVLVSVLISRGTWD